MVPEPPSEPLQTRVFRLLYQMSGRKPGVDALLSRRLKYRYYLPEVDAHDVIPRFEETEIRIKRLPVGAWSTPLIDAAIVIKAALGFEAKRILEIGSYRGDTARLLAENTAEDIRICTVDIDPRHGEAYRGTPLERRIDRRVGAVSMGLFQTGEKFDLIFVDANHDFASVVNDTEVALKVCSPQGVILWHDYAQDMYFHDLCGVPEALHHFAETRRIVGIRGTRLALYSSRLESNTATVNTVSANPSAQSVWDERQVRG
ncbi:MAG TPA: class I SAM-dependent methyltransferase [Candidatus Acidoferrum sp.]|nr:class I SAM-dependent methyltransferase [Candidatus Acidoferrum sp.]